jgi:putative membrane protein insertion efficiency factor
MSDHASEGRKEGAVTGNDTGAVPGRTARAARSLVTAPIMVYQKAISPLIPRRCKYEPSCSRYAVDAVRQYGVLRGLVLAAWRLLRCNPWSYGGYDPVEAQHVFRSGSATSA